MRRHIVVIGAVVALVAGLGVADGFVLVVTDPATTIKNIVTAALKSQILDAVIQEARQVRRMARRLSVFTDLAKYSVREPTRWRSYRYQDQNLYVNPYVEALNFGDPDGAAYEAVSRTRSGVGPALGAVREDAPQVEA